MSISGPNVTHICSCNPLIVQFTTVRKDSKKETKTVKERKCDTVMCDETKTTFNQQKCLPLFKNTVSSITLQAKTKLTEILKINSKHTLQAGLTLIIEKLSNKMYIEVWSSRLKTCQFNFNIYA